MFEIMEEDTRRISQRHKTVSRDLEFLRTPHLILTKIKVDSKLLEHFLDRHSGNNSLVLSTSPRKCVRLSTVRTRTCTSALPKSKTKPKLKKVVAKPNSLVVSFRLEGKFKEFILKKFTKNHRILSRKQKAVCNSIRREIKTEQTPPPSARLRVRGGETKSEIKKKKKHLCTKSTTCSSNLDKSLSSNHAPDIATAIVSCELEAKLPENIDEVFKVLEEEVDAIIQAQQLLDEDSVRDQKTSNTRLSKHSKFLEDVPEDSSLQLPVKRAKKKRTGHILDSSSEEECEDTCQLKAASPLPSSTEVVTAVKIVNELEPSITTSPAKSPILNRERSYLQPAVIPFSASPVLVCKSSKGESNVDVKQSPTKEDTEQMTPEHPTDPTCFNQNKDESHSLGLEPDLLGNVQQNVSDSLATLLSEPCIDMLGDELYDISTDFLLVAMEAELLGCAPFQEADVLAVPNVSLLSQPADTSTDNIPLHLDCNFLVDEQAMEGCVTPCGGGQDMQTTTPNLIGCTMAELKETSLNLSGVESHSVDACKKKVSCAMESVDACKEKVSSAMESVDACKEKVSCGVESHSVDACKKKVSCAMESVDASKEKVSSGVESHSVDAKVSSEVDNKGGLLKVVVNTNSPVTKRPRGRPRKHPKPTQEDKPKRPRGRPRKKPLPVLPSAKKESLSTPVIQGPSLTLLKCGEKKHKRTKKDRSDKKTAALIAGVFEKLTTSAAPDRLKLNVLPEDKSTHQLTVEDSGYTTSLSNSEYSSRGSRGPASRSPDENVVSLGSSVEKAMSPVLHSYLHSDLGDLSFDDSIQQVLIKANQDPILQGSHVLESISRTPIQSEEIDISVLESSGLNIVSQSHTLDSISQDTATTSMFNLLPSFTFDDVMGDNSSMATASNLRGSEMIFPELGVFLRNKGDDNPVHLFDQEEMVIVKAGDVGETQEIASYEDVDDILGSETVSDCLKELQLSGRIGSGVIVSETTMVPIIPAEVIIATDCSPNIKEDHYLNRIDSEQIIGPPITKVANDKTPSGSKRRTKSTSGAGNVRRFVKTRETGVTKLPRLKRIKVSRTTGVNSSADSLQNTATVSHSLNVSCETEKDTWLTKDPPLPMSLIHGRTKSGRTSRPSSKLLESFVHQEEAYLSNHSHSLQDNSKVVSPTVQEAETLSTASVRGTGSLSPCEEEATESSDPVVAMKVVENCCCPIKVKNVNGKSCKAATKSKSTKPTIPRVTPPSPVSQATPVYSPGTTIVCHSPKSPFALKLRDFNVSLSRRPLHSLSRFSFKLPDQASDRTAASLRNSCVNKSVGDTSLKSPSKFSFTLNSESKSPPPATTSSIGTGVGGKRSVSKLTPSNFTTVSSKKAREVMFREGNKSNELLCSEKKPTTLSPFVSNTLTASTSVPAFKCSSLPKSPTTNSLNMSLDVILGELENSHQKSTAKQPSMQPREERLVKIKSSDTRAKSLHNLSILDRLEPNPRENKRVVKFADSQPSCSLDFDGTLTDRDISDLMLPPLDVGSSLDQVLQGESLFGEKLEKTDPFHELDLAEKPIKNSKPSTSKVETKPCVVSFDENDKDNSNPNCSTLVTSPRQRLPAVAETEPANQIPSGDSMKSPKNPNPFQTITKTSKSPQKLKQRVSFNFSLSTDNVPPSVRQSRDCTSPEKVTNVPKSPPTKKSVTERKVRIKEEPCFDESTSQNLPRKAVTSDSPEEDVIDLHADDTDMFDTNVKESPLSKIFKKPSSSSKESANRHAHGAVLAEPSCTKEVSRFPPYKVDPKKGCISAKSLPSSSSLWASQRKQLLRSPLCTYKQPLMSYPISEGGSSPGYDNPPALMPYKKQQVSQWVAEQQRRVGYNPSYPLSSSFNAPVPNQFEHRIGPKGNWNGNSSNGSYVGNRNGGQFGDGFWRGSFDDPPPPPPPPRPQGHLPPPFAATELPSGPNPNYGHEIFTGVSGPSLEGHCRYFLRGKCDFIHCKFKHASVSSVPLHVLEAAVFQMGGVDHLSVDVLCRYSNDLQSCSLLKNNQRKFNDLVRGVMNKSFTVVATNYLPLASWGVKFNQSFLCRIIEVCSTHPPSSSTHDHMQPVAFADKVFSDLKQRPEAVPREIYYHYLKALTNSDPALTNGDTALRVIEVYESMRAAGVAPNLDIVLLMLRLGKALEHKVFDVLEDTKYCSSLQQPRCVNRLLDIIDYQLLLKHSTKVESWIEQAPDSVIQKLNLESFDKLFRAFSHDQQWNSLTILLDSCPGYLGSIETSQLCEILNSAVRMLGPTDKVEAVMCRLTEDQLSGITLEVWDSVITNCAEKRRSQKAFKFCRTASHYKKQLSIKTSSSLMALHLSQHDPPSAIALLKQSLDNTPSVLPPLPLLISLCQAMDTPQDVHLVIRTLLFTNTMPPPAILQCLLNTHSKHKVYPTLAEVVKLSLDYNLLLDKLFYQKVLIELRQWGRDQDAISTVYKALRKVENQEDVDDHVEGHWDDSGCTGLGRTTTSELSLYQGVSKSGTLCQPPEGGTVDLFSSSSATNLTPLTFTSSKVELGVNARGVSVNGKGGVVEGVASPSLSLEGVLQQSLSQDPSSLIKLIEVNGGQGQFGAVASILVSMPCSQSHYDNQTVHAVWKAITNSSLRSANAFSCFLSSLNQSRVSMIKSPSSPTPTCSSLFSSDRWLVSQIGIALLKTCEQNQDWQSGFVILHHLHRFGIHYVKLSQPNSNLPPCSHASHTPCLVALMAVNVCLHIDQVSGALEVFQGCEWIQAANTDELNLRTRMLLETAEKCFQRKMNQEGWKCLQAINSGVIMKKFIHAVCNLHNKLLQTLLSSKDMSFALQVIHTMRGKQLQCLPSYFSILLQNLHNSGQESLARDLCKSAIADNCYCGLARDNLFRVTLPMGLVRIELYLLLEDHLKKIGARVGEDKLQPLVIQSCAGSRSNLESVFAFDFNPPLLAKFALKGNTVTIPPDSLKQWCTAHVKTLMVALTSSNVKLPPPTLTSEPRPVVPGLSEPLRGETVKCLSEECASPLRKTVRLRMKRPVRELEEDECTGPVLKHPKLEKKHFREEVCRTFIENLKPHYQAGKFKSPADYTHFLKTLSLNYFKTCKSKEKTPPTSLTDQMKTQIGTIVANFMTKVHTYSADMDTELGLSCSTSDSV